VCRRRVKTLKHRKTPWPPLLFDPLKYTCIFISRPKMIFAMTCRRVGGCVDVSGERVYINFGGAGAAWVNETSYYQICLHRPTTVGKTWILHERI
jgi:hypothetical protein